MSSSWYHNYEQDKTDKKRMDEEHRKKERFIEKACSAYCKICDTQECEGTGECGWVKKFEKQLRKEL